MSKLLNINLSLKLLLILIGTLLFGDYLPASLQSGLYAISVTLKSVLLFILPVIIFSCLFSCILSQRGKALSFMIGLLLLVCVSNYFSTLIAYTVGSFGLTDIDLAAHAHAANGSELAPMWDFQLPKWISNDYALYSALLFGFFFSIFPNERASSFADKAKNLVTLFLKKAFIPVLPLFALGFILKMQYDGILGKIIETYLPLIVLIAIINTIYLAFLFAAAAGFKKDKWLEYLKNVIPAGMMGFSTMSSMATLPVTLEAADKNTNQSDIARAVVPATVNIHLVGDSIGIPLMAIAILLNFGFDFPSFSVYGIFALFFVLAKFAVAAVPGGGILVMIPVLEQHLGFSGEMSALITALYILFDPVITATNVLGNSVMAIILSKIFGKQPEQNGKAVEA